MLTAPTPSPYDLHFAVGPFPVRVTWTHWLASLVLGWNGVTFGHNVGLLESSDPQPVFLLIWVAVLFVSILVHELGHAVAIRWFGADCEIVLYHFGGLAVSRGRRETTARTIIISLAGPAAGFVLYGVVWLAAVYGLPRLPAAESPLTRAAVWFAVDSLVFINLTWGLVNLLPVYPLDGGQVSRAVCLAINRREGVVWSTWITVATAAAAAVWLWSVGQPMAGVLFAVLGVQAYLGLTGRSLRG